MPTGLDQKPEIKQHPPKGRRLWPVLLLCCGLAAVLCLWSVASARQSVAGPVPAPPPAPETTPASEPLLPTEPPEETVSAAPLYDFSQPAPEGGEAEEDYFSDAVFLGDSRTDGLRLYSGIRPGGVIYHNGLIVFEAADRENKCIKGADGQKHAVLELLDRHFELTIFYYNPTIVPDEEYHRREQELECFLEQAGYPHITLIEPEYDPAEFYAAARGLEQEPEKGERCTACYKLRLEKTAKYAAENGFPWFTTTLSISPVKDPVRINSIGSEMAEKYGVSFLTSEFRKRDGYKRSLELSREYGLYRQDYCGCVFSRREREKSDR